MHDAEARVAFVVRGVVRQAMRDADARGLRLLEAESDASRLIRRWCDVPVAASAPSLSFSALNKTELLLAGVDERADLYPVGDLYASELAEFVKLQPGNVVARLAEQAGGLLALDVLLRRLLDERSDAEAAFATAPQLRDPLLARLRVTRFRRGQLGIIPKLGARTIGIDLFI